MKKLMTYLLAAAIFLPTQGMCELPLPPNLVDKDLIELYNTLQRNNRQDRLDDFQDRQLLQGRELIELQRERNRLLQQRLMEMEEEDGD